MTLVLRSWLASRCALPAAAVGILSSTVIGVLPPTGLEIGHWTNRPPLTIPYANILGLAAALVGCVLIQSATPEWERSNQRTRLQRAHTATWALFAVGISSIGPIIVAIRIHYEPHPWAVVLTQLFVCGVAATAVGLLGGLFGGALTVLAVVAVVAVEETTGLRWIIGDPFNRLAWPATTTVLVLGALTQWRRRGIPSLRRASLTD